MNFREEKKFNMVGVEKTSNLIKEEANSPFYFKTLMNDVL